jgi:hypothetical protein
MYELVVKRYADVSDQELISVGDIWTFANIKAFADAHNSGLFDAAEILYCGSKDAFTMTPKNAYVIVWVKV